MEMSLQTMSSSTSTTAATPTAPRPQRSSLLGLIGRKKKATTSDPSPVAAASPDPNPCPDVPTRTGRRSPCPPTQEEPSTSSTSGLAQRLMKRRSLGAKATVDPSSAEPSLSTPIPSTASTSPGASSSSNSPPLARSTSNPFPLPQPPATQAPIPTPVNDSRPAASRSKRSPKSPKSYKVRLVPHLSTTISTSNGTGNRTLSFAPITRTSKVGGVPLRIGRYLDTNLGHFDAPGLLGTVRDDKRPDKFAFRSKVVSRNHALIWADKEGQFWIKDTRSSSGTFLNHVRLSPPHQESAPQPLRDGDTLQLGVDYQGGRENYYKCVRIKVELGASLLNRREGASGSSFNNAAMQLLRTLQGYDHIADQTLLSGPPAIGDKKGIDKEKSKLKSDLPVRKKIAAGDCCICLFPVQIYQAIFISPCSHAFHYKCIRPLLELHHPGFACALCRTYADLDADVECGDEEDELDIEEGDEDGEDYVDDGDDGVRGRTPPESSMVPRAGGQPRSPTHLQAVTMSTLDPSGAVGMVGPAVLSESTSERQDHQERVDMLERMERDTLELALEVSRIEYEDTHQASTSTTEPVAEHGTGSTATMTPRGQLIGGGRPSSPISPTSARTSSLTPIDTTLPASDSLPHSHSTIDPSSPPRPSEAIPFPHTNTSSENGTPLGHPHPIYQHSDYYFTAHSRDITRVNSPLSQSPPSELSTMLSPSGSTGSLTGVTTNSTGSSWYFEPSTPINHHTHLSPLLRNSTIASSPPNSSGMHALPGSTSGRGPHGANASNLYLQAASRGLDDVSERSDELEHDKINTVVSTTSRDGDSSLGEGFREPSSSPSATATSFSSSSLGYSKRDHHSQTRRQRQPTGGSSSDSGSLSRMASDMSLGQSKRS